MRNIGPHIVQFIQIVKEIWWNFQFSLPWSRGGHREARDGHREARDGHREARDGHREARDGHREARDSHREARDGHREARDGHREARDGLLSHCSLKYIKLGEDKRLKG